MEYILFPTLLVISGLIMWIEKLQTQRAEIQKRLNNLEFLELNKRRDERLEEWAKSIDDPNAELEKLQSLHLEESMRIDDDFRKFRTSWKPSFFQKLLSPPKAFGEFHQWKDSQIIREFRESHKYPEKEELAAKIYALKRHS